MNTFSSDEVPLRPETFVDLLRARAAAHPSRVLYRFLADGEREAGVMTYAEADRRARAVADLLLAHGAAGERVLLMYPPGLDYIAAFLGCLYAGAAAVPAYPPNVRKPDRTLPRLTAVVRDCQPRLVLTTSAFVGGRDGICALAPELAGVAWLATDARAQGERDAEWEGPTLRGDTLAFLQYTSGSTGAPRGVMLDHRALLANARQTTVSAFGGDCGPRAFVSWLPLYHDMGLIGCVLQPLYLGGESALMPPVAFLKAPARWLQAISTYRAACSGAPNFAYELCARKIADEDLAGVDLSGWQVAFNGSEPLAPDTFDRFTERFAPHGFRPEAFLPCYGLAEATLYVTGRMAPRRVYAGAGTTVHASSGVPAGGLRVRVVDPHTGVVHAEGIDGEIWVQGDSVARGYWGRPDESDATFRAHAVGESGTFLRTGDLGFMHEGELVVTGRAKDLIIVKGRNLYPQDIERTVEEASDAVRSGCTAAIGITVEREERIVVIAEADRSRLNDAVAVFAAIRDRVADVHEVPLHEIVLLRPGRIHKTTSGKIQRHANRGAYLEGSLDVVARSGIRTGTPTVHPPDAVLVADVLATITRILGSLAVPAELVSPEASLRGTLGLDSVDVVELEAKLEQHYRLRSRVEDYADMDTVGALCSYVADRLVARAV